MENELMLRGETEGGLLDQMTLLDKRMAEIQNELQQQEMRFKHLHDERGLLEQLHTINQMTSRKMNDEVFGEGKMFPSRKLFLERLPDPEEFAKVALKTAHRNLEEGAEDAQQILDEVMSRDPMSLLYEEVVHVLESYIKEPKIEMRMDPITEVFLGCAVVTCASLDEAERALTNLTGRWLLPPSTNQPVQIHYVDEIIEPKVVVESLPPDVTSQALRELLSHFGSIEEFDCRERKDRRGVESTTVRFATIDDAYTAIALQHGCPIPPAIYELEMEGDQDELLPALAQQLNLRPDDVVPIEGPQPVEGGRFVLDVSISAVGPDQVSQLLDIEEVPRVTAVVPPATIALRLPKKRKKIRPEDQEQLVLLDDKLKLEKEKTSALEKELRQVLEPQLRAKRDAADKANAELEAMRQATGWDERKQYSTHTQMDRENQISELLNELAQLQVEQTSLKEQNIKKTAQIEQLAKVLLTKDQIVEDCQMLQEQLRMKEIEYKDRVESVRTLTRILNKKEKLTDDLHTADDTKQVKALESDKKVLQHEISRHVESRRAAEKTIQAQHHRLTQLDNRIRAIAAALKELHDKDDEDSLRYRPDDWNHGDDDVSYAAYGEMQGELQACRKKLMQKDLYMLEKDANIEALEKKIEILTHAKSSNLKRANNDQRHLQSDYEMFKDFKEQQQKEAEAKKEEIKEDTRSLDKKYKRISESMYGG
eukprot:TRINITY_DN10355_c0_g2_i1.p1 TRINITY_DN10355_c0_g2~~TRINITY_DN10355_c0_g2_i1.p1  ORF type:complete len:729 (+),score=280.27 TRINITY_DN10355_c0_g2_i1:62-2188(+)